ncbi:MAG: phosphoenolpyruvate synthase [Gammaproteobacteria bacterium]|nr:phosphoenolpyruvate synthase [Gammaproteobacteria bacterium]MBQ0840284.1 phosphoenolpyruvate synthase [Gammaproteobacteria bacterium]
MSNKHASPKYIRWFDELSNDDVALVGGKNASLGELYQQLVPVGVKVPNGFAITAQAYYYVLEQGGALQALRETLAELDPDDIGSLSTCGARARAIVYDAGLPADLQAEIIAAATQLRDGYSGELSLAVRSSATAEDLPEASFAGQHDSFLNLRSDEELLESCRRCFASLFTNRAIHYRVDQGFDHFSVALSIGVMKMVRSDLAASGVMFSIDTETGFPDVAFITGTYGLGETVVQGAVAPDEFYVHKPTYEQGYRAVLRRNLGSKRVKMVYASAAVKTQATETIETELAAQQRFCIDDAEVLQLAAYCIKVERHYSNKTGRKGQVVAMDMEWAKDGLDGELYVIQARPETVVGRQSKVLLKQYQLGSQRGAIVTRGRAVGTSIATGRARIIHRASELENFQPGEILVSNITAPDWEPVMKTAAAIVTDSGGRTCHAAIIARELGITAVVGTGDATTCIEDGQVLTVNCAEGDQGVVYEGELEWQVAETNIDELARPKTKIMVNLGNPELAFKTSFIPNDGVGLARMEFIIGEYIKAHPMALLYPQRVSDKQQRQTLQALTQAYTSPSEYFVQRLSEGVGTIAAAFYPKPVVVRMSDFKSNEYAALVGGADFELDENNPMIGFRGASRYTHPAYAEGFDLECKAMLRVREEMGLSNVILMIPFCRRIEEAKAVLAAMARNGLVRGENGLQVYVMCEIPNNVILIDDFAQLFDGFSIGSNDLTQLTLGVDRDSEIVAFDFDERDPGVKQMIRLAVEGARRNQRHSGLCGQAPSDYPEMAEFLVELGIDAISLTPDSLIATTRLVLEVEKKLGR